MTHVAYWLHIETANYIDAFALHCTATVSLISTGKF